MKILWICSFLIISFLWSISSQVYANIVKTSSGPIQGTPVNLHDTIVKQYLGIPFAEPPIGQLRFQKPKPVKPWSTVLKADKPGSACIQYVDYPYPWYDMYGPKSEDCLYLNIWVPQSKQNNTKKPIMFWIHGGAYSVGSNQMSLYNGTALAAGGGIIVVTTNYRLSAIGFLTTHSDTAPGNAGLYDILEALKWVNRNIEVFGGDPGQVTLAGESVGAITVGIFCVSPLTKGLFSRVIMESGAPIFLERGNNIAAMEKSQRLAEALDCADNVTTIFDDPDCVVDCLRKKCTFEIIKKEHSFHPKKIKSDWLVYGDELIPINPRKALIAGNIHDVDVLIGNNQDEGSHIEAISDINIFGTFGLNNPEINKTFGESIMDDFFKDFPDKDAVKKYYLGNLTENDYDKVREQVYTSMGDKKNLCPTKYFAETYVRLGKKVYFYFFTHRPSTTPWAEWMKVAHFEEVQFVFGQALLNPTLYTPEEVNLSAQIISIWTDFVKYGTPKILQQNGFARSTWPLYSREQPQYGTLNAERLSIGEGPHKENCDFFRPYFGFD